jgi:plasmid stabilization system protein ParE
MKVHEIVFAPSAEWDIEDVIDWLNQHAPEKTGEWLDSLKSTIQKLATLPERCPLAPENGLWGEEELRQLLFREYPSQYRIIFSIADDTVRILSIRHGARRYLYEE